MSSSANSTKPPLSQNALIVMMASLMSMQAFGIDAMLPALGEMAADMGAGGNDRQLVISSYFLGAGLGAVFPGILADRFGRRPVVLGSLVIYVVFSAICAAAQDFTVLVASRFTQGFLCVGLSVMPAAIVRDQMEGDAMARIMSLVAMTFLVVPLLAPAFGQAILLVADWRAIYGFMSIAGVALMAWVWWRLPETLEENNRQMVEPMVILKNLSLTFSNRVSLGYVTGSALVFGSLFGFLNSSQQMVDEVFEMGEYFAFVFGAAVFGMIIASFTNSRIVERFGARRVSHTALLGYLAVSILQVIAGLQEEQSIWIFLPLLTLNLTMLGFVGANFSSIAMQPFDSSAGAASSVQTAVRMAAGGVLGALIGRAYDGTVMPMALCMVAAALFSLAMVLIAERGKLFRRPGQAHRYMTQYEYFRK